VTYSSLLNKLWASFGIDFCLSPTRANSGTIVGNFELDFAEGEIRYKTSIDVEGDRLSSALIKQMVYANVTMMDRYLPGIMSVIYSNVSPSDAIAQIEASPSATPEQDSE